MDYSKVKERANAIVNMDLNELKGLIDEQNLDEEGLEIFLQEMESLYYREFAYKNVGKDGKCLGYYEESVRKGYDITREFKKRELLFASKSVDSVLTPVYSDLELALLYLRMIEANELSIEAIDKAELIAFVAEMKKDAKSNNDFDLQNKI